MNDITIKSTGFLIDELITSRFKVEVSPTPDNVHRMRLLDAAVRLRLNGREDDIYLQVVKLQLVLRQCWDAQEVIRDAKIEKMPFITSVKYPYYSTNYPIADFQYLEKIARAGIKAQETNAERNKLIKEIDTMLGEADISPLGKTYG